MLLNIYCSKNPCPSIKLSSAYRRLVPIQKVENGVVVNTSEYQYFDVAADNAKFTSADFQISNILAVGAYDMLKPVVVSQIGQMDFADKFDSLITQNDAQVS